MRLSFRPCSAYTAIITLILGGVLSAQVSNPQIQFVTSDPTGNTCSNTRIQMRTPNGVFYTCQSGHMAAATGGSTSYPGVTSDGANGLTVTGGASFGGNVLVRNALLGSPIATPSPDSTKTQWYVKTGGAWCQQTPGAVETCMGTGGGGMIYPAAGIPQSVTGTSWGSSLGLVATVASPGVDTNLATEKAIRTAISAVTASSLGLVIGANVQAYSANLTTWAGLASGNATTAASLASTPTKCSAGNYPLGVDASGNAQNCTAAGGTQPVMTATFLLCAGPCVANETSNWKWSAPAIATVTGCLVDAVTYPTGAAITVDLLKAGTTTLFISTVPTLTAGSSAYNEQTGMAAAAVLAKGDYLIAKVLTVGSTIAGQNINLTCKVTY